MVGGIIVEVVSIKDTLRVAVLVRGTDMERNDFSAINIETEANQVEVGDRIWWQGGQAMWTPRKGNREYMLPKIGFSYSRERFEVIKTEQAFASKS